jgi:hypothetical protein
MHWRTDGMLLLQMLLNQSSLTFTMFHAAGGLLAVLMWLSPARGVMRARKAGELGVRSGNTSMFLLM